MPALLRVFTILLLAAGPVVAQDDIADVTSKELKGGKDDHKKYLLIDPPKKAAPKGGYGLIVVLPGGDGSVDFHPFVKRIYKNAVPDGFLLAQLVAKKWTDEQQIVWPTAKNKVAEMKFTTEEFIDAVVGDVAKAQTVDPTRTFTLSWSSGGPAAYAASLGDGKVAGSFVAMSVFKPDQLPDLAKAKGRPYYLYHSPDDRVCPYRMAEQAEKALTKAGAAVKLAAYDGGHGWRGDLYADIRTGLDWLDEHKPKK